MTDRTSPDSFPFPGRGRHRSGLLSLLLGLLLALGAGCPAPGDDDDSGDDDDDDSGDDDDSSPSTCDDPDLAAELEALATWPGVIGCGDAWFGISNGADTRLVRSYVAVTEAVVGNTYTVVLDGSFEPKDGVEGWLALDQGVGLAQTMCNDVLFPPGPTVERSWTGITGTLTFTVDSIDEETPQFYTGSLSLSGVSVQAEDNGSICSLPDTQWSALSLGWYAG